MQIGELLLLGLDASVTLSPLLVARWLRRHGQMALILLVRLCILCDAFILGQVRRRNVVVACQIAIVG